MKKIALFLGAALALATTACDDMLPNPEIQQNPELPLFKADNLEIAQANGSEVIDLQALTEQAKDVELAQVTKLVDFPETSVLTFAVEASLTPDFAKNATVEFTPVDNDVVTSTLTLNSLISDNFTRTPGEYTVYTRWAAYAVNGNSRMRIGGADKYYGEYTYKFKTMKPVRELADAYVLRYRTSAAGTWQTMPMVKNNPDATSYDDGGYTALVDVLAPDFQWTVVPANDTETENVIGVAADASTVLSGKLIEGATAAAQVINAKAQVTIAIDVYDLTYGVVPATVPAIYIPSETTSLTDFSKMFTLSTDNFDDFTGTAPLKGKWYMAAQAAPQGLFFMPTSYVMNKGNMLGSLTMAYEPTGMEAFEVEAGLYIIKAKFSDMAVQAINVPVISAIGGFCGWDTGKAPDLKPNDDFSVWTLKNLEVAEAGEFKFCVSHDWAYSFGGSLNDIVQNGGNLSIGAGKYDITLDFSNQPATCTVTPK